MIITLTLNPSVDYIMQVPQIRMEDTLRASNAYFQAGGKGINVSRVLTRLDVSNIAWGFCGGDTGNWLKSYLDEEQVPYDFVETRAGTRINSIITELSTHKQLRISTGGGRILNQEEQILLNRFKNLPLDTTWIALGGSLPPGLTPGCMRKLIGFAHEQNIPAVLDADGQVLEEGIQARPYLIKPNQYELERLLGEPVETPEAIVRGARSLIDEGLVQVVVVSLASEGAFLVSREATLKAWAPPVPVLSKVGAGDSMVAGLVKGLAEKKPPDEMLRMGVAAGTAAVMTPGTELCLAHDYEKLLSQVKVEAFTLV